jgi:hypothetical protein
MGARLRVERHGERRPHEGRATRIAVAMDLQARGGAIPPCPRSLPLGVGACRLDRAIVQGIWSEPRPLPSSCCSSLPRCPCTPSACIFIFGPRSVRRVAGLIRSSLGAVEFSHRHAALAGSSALGAHPSRSMMRLSSTPDDVSLRLLARRGRTIGSRNWRRFGRLAAS